MTQRSELRTRWTGRKTGAGTQATDRKGSYREESTVYDQSSSDPLYVLRMMMFYEAAGGRRLHRLDQRLSAIRRFQRAVEDRPGDPRGPGPRRRRRWPRERRAARRRPPARPGPQDRHAVGLYSLRAAGEEDNEQWGPPPRKFSPSHDQDPRPYQSLRRLARHQQPDAGVERGRPVRLHRPQRVGQDHDHADAGHALAAHLGRGRPSAATRSTRIPRRSAASSATCPTSSASTTT